MRVSFQYCATCVVCLCLAACTGTSDDEPLSTPAAIAPSAATSPTGTSLGGETTGPTHSSPCPPAGCNGDETTTSVGDTSVGSDANPGNASSVTSGPGGSNTAGSATGDVAADDMTPVGGMPADDMTTAGDVPGDDVSAGGAASGDTSTDDMAAAGGAGGSNMSTGGAGPGEMPTDGPGPDGYPLGNPPVPSAGCGTNPTLSSGTHQMTSAGLDREYILELPDNYDPDKPYRLLFGMHWLGGSAEAVQGWSGWWGLDALDTEDSVIWVAPQGYTDQSPWRGRDDSDHIFFDELYQTLASDLCIDTSRVFSLGFSFGAMFTNALAQTHQDVLRGVVVYATADYNIYFPENTGEPLAYMGVHGINDPTCPIESGRSSRDRFVTNNECSVPDSVPEAQRGDSEVIYDFDCPDNYPIRWVTFDGAHTYPPNDEEGVWVYGVTWDFITQF